MKKYDIKDNVDEMILQICKYIKSADLSDEDDFAIKIESGLTLLTSAIDFTDKPDENILYIAEQLEKISMITVYMLLDAARNVVNGNVDESRYL